MLCYYEVVNCCVMHCKILMFHFRTLQVSKCLANISISSFNYCILIKGWLNKNLPMQTFVFAISQLKNHRNLKILVPTPHNTLVIMWGRDKNFQVLMIFQLKIAKTKFYLLRFFFSHPLYLCFLLTWKTSSPSLSLLINISSSTFL